MVLITRDAKSIAKRWVDQQEDIPNNRSILIREYNYRVKGRRFDVQYAVAASPEQFLLLRFYVLDDGTVLVTRDRRAHVRQLLAERNILMEDQPKARGYDHIEAVQRFVDALNMQTDDKPEWFVDFQLVPEVTRFALTDGYTRITIPTKKGLRLAEVGVKIKTSTAGKASYFKAVSPKKSTRTIVLVVRPDNTDEQLRSEFYRHLGEKLRNRLV